jgi:hypothetical protein
LRSGDQCGEKEGEECGELDDGSHRRWRDLKIQVEGFCFENERGRTGDYLYAREEES